ADVAVRVLTRGAVLHRGVELIALSGAVTASRRALVAEVVARLAVRQDVVLIAETRLAARLRADVAVRVFTRGAVLHRSVELIALSGAVTASRRALVAGVVARL